MIDLLAPLPTVAEDKLHWAFKLLIAEEKYAPARDKLREVWAAFPNPDVHFIREFQTAGFDARVWELVLAAVGQFGPYSVSRPHEAPDFLFERAGFRVWVEATTANLSAKPQDVDGPEDELEAKFHELNDVIPIRLGSPLYSKLTKAYWNQAHVAGQSFVIAITDFAGEDPVRTSDAPLFRYLYGMDHKVVSLPGEPVEIEMGAFPISRSSAVCRQRWTVRLGEVEPVFGQTGRVLLDITARTAHDGALKWTRPSTPRAARSILATFPSTCALPSGGRWSLRRVLQRPGRQRKRSSAKSSCGSSRTSSSAPSSPPCCNARCAPPRLATRRAPSCATCPGGCGATAWRPSTFAPPGARRCRSPRRTTARNTPVGRSGGRDSTP